MPRAGRGRRDAAERPTLRPVPTYATRTSTATEPVLGWRLWSLCEDGLESWAVDYRWRPGENVATCLDAGRRRCATAPGPGCLCGFWGLWRPSLCVVRACVAPEPPWHVLGLIAGWGSVALHGREGFRAERAGLRCLFTDRMWAAPWLRGRAGVGAAHIHHVGPALIRLRAAAARYGVPLLAVRDAAQVGLLAELGVPEPQVAEAVELASRWTRPGLDEGRLAPW